MVDFKNTFTIRLSLKNKPIYNILDILADQAGMSTNKYIEDILVDHLNKRGLTWDVTDNADLLSRKRMRKGRNGSN